MGTILHFMLGFITSFLGSISPSLLNMNAAKVSINKGKFEAVKFSIGVSIVVLLQAYIAILFTKFLNDNPNFIVSLQKIAVVIFLLLSLYFYLEFKKDKKPNENFKEKAGNSFLIGLLLSTLNMFAIPFYFGVTRALDVAGWLQFSQQNILAFVIGSALGTFIMLYFYANYATIIELKSKVLAKNLNLVLSILTAAVAIITIIKLI